MKNNKVKHLGTQSTFISSNKYFQLINLDQILLTMHKVIQIVTLTYAWRLYCIVSKIPSCKLSDFSIFSFCIIFCKFFQLIHIINGNVLTVIIKRTYKKSSQLVCLKRWEKEQRKNLARVREVVTSSWLNECFISIPVKNDRLYLY